MNAISLEFISNPILRATIRDIMERVYGIQPMPGQMDLTNTFPGSTPDRAQTDIGGNVIMFEKKPAIPAPSAGKHYEGGRIMKLWQLKRGDRFHVVRVNDRRSALFIFDHVDGAYSFCTFADGPNKGEAIHIDASATVEIDAPHTISERSEATKGPPNARDALTPERLATA